MYLIISICLPLAVYLLYPLGNVSHVYFGIILVQKLTPLTLCPPFNPGPIFFQIKSALWGQREDYHLGESERAVWYILFDIYVIHRHTRTDTRGHHNKPYPAKLRAGFNNIG